MPGFLGEARGELEVVLGTLVAPGADGGGGVWVAEGEVFAVRAVLCLLAMYGSSVYGDVRNAAICTVGPSCWHRRPVYRSILMCRRRVRCGSRC